MPWRVKHPYVFRVTLPDHDNSSSPSDPPLMAYVREVRARGLMACCFDMLSKSRRITGVGSQAECPVCHAVVQVDEHGAWTWLPFDTAQVLRRWSVYG